MTVAEIQSVVAMYLQRSVAKFDVSGTGANLILVAMNNARKYAERRHNWSVCRKKGYLSVTTGNEVAWDSPTWFGGGTEKLKEGKHWWLRGDATDVTNKVSTTDCPIKILGHGVKHVVETKQNYESWGEDYAELRQVRESSSWHPMLNQPHGVVRGKWLELYPKPTATQLLVVDGYAWWPQWVETTSYSNRYTIPSSVNGYVDDDSYVYLSLTTTSPSKTIQGIAIVDFADDGANTEGLAAPYGTKGIPSISVQDFNNFAGEIYPEMLHTALLKFGFDLSLESGVLYLDAEGTHGSCTIVKYDSNSGTFLVSTSLTPVVTTLTGADTSDWWTENAEEYLILRTLVECNRLGHVFTGNKEGNLPSPEKQAEQALQDLILQDNAGELAGGQIELY